jgi:hypothetical protein
MSWASNFTFSMPAWASDRSHKPARQKQQSPADVTAAKLREEWNNLVILDEMAPYVLANPNQTCADLQKQWSVSGEMINLRFPWMKCDEK